MAYSKDNVGVGWAHEITSCKLASIFPENDGQYQLGSNKLSDQSEMFSKLPDAFRLA